MADGSDFGGSIRVPASCCGLFGLKPTLWQASAGSQGWWPSAMVFHVITRTVRDSAALLGLKSRQVHGRVLSDLNRPVRSLRIAYVRNPLDGKKITVDPECINASDRAAKLCAALGHHVEEERLVLEGIEEDFFSIWGSEFQQVITAIERRIKRPINCADVEGHIYSIMESVRKISPEAVREARRNLARLKDEIAEFLRRYDVILSPTQAVSSVAASLGGGSLDRAQVADAMGAYTYVYNATGQPAMSVPLYWTPQEIPVGAMFAGRHGEELLLLRLAAQLEEAQPWFNKVPHL